MNIYKSDCSDQSPLQSQHHASPCPSYAYTKAQRLLNSAQFSKVFDDAPIRAAHPSLLILARPNDTGQARLGLVIAKKHVRKANQRNRLKRICRETFRLRQHKLPPIDAIVLARRGADNVSPEELHTILNGLWKRIIKRAQ